MELPYPIPVEELAAKVEAKKILGSKKLKATGINEIHKVRKGDITFVDTEKYYKHSLSSAASIILINKEVKCPKGKALLICDDPFEVYNDLVLEFRPFRPIEEEIAKSLKIPPTTVIEPGAVIAPNVQLGEYCYIQANVTITEDTIIGDHVTIEAGSSIGTSAFYFKKSEKGYKKWRSGGRVIIEDHVDIGANCTINRGVSGDTIIGEGTKLDCHIHIGHDVVIGKHCMLAAQVGIGGNTTIEDWVILYGQVGIAQNVTIGAKAVILAKSGVSKDLEGGKTYFGIPADEIRSKYKEVAALRHLPKFFSDYYR